MRQELLQGLIGYARQGVFHHAALNPKLQFRGVLIFKPRTTFSCGLQVLAMSVDLPGQFVDPITR